MTDMSGIGSKCAKGKMVLVPFDPRTSLLTLYCPYQRGSLSRFR